MDLSHWKQALFEANQATIMNFVDWVCEEYQITSEGSSWVYFREWKQLYQKETGKTISWHETKEIKKVPQIDLCIFVKRSRLLRLIKILLHSSMILL